MTALTFHGRRDLRLEEVPEPAPARGEVLVRVTDCLLSQGIIDFNLEGHFVDLSLPHPETGLGFGLVLGQQFGGVIEAVGPGVDPARVGEHVGVAPGFGCGRCASCAAGRQNHCDRYAYYGLLGAHGGLAPRCAVRAGCAVAVPAPHLGVLLEATLVVHSLIRKARPWLAEADRVFVLGAGPVGLSAASLLRDAYDVGVVLHDVLPGRRARAERIGFSVARERDLERSYPLVLDCAGTNPETGGSALLDGLTRVAKGGALMFVGTYLHQTPIAPMDLLFREITIGSSFAYTDADVAGLVPLLPRLQLDLEAIAEPLSLEAAVGPGLLRGEVDRDGFTALIVRP